MGTIRLSLFKTYCLEVGQGQNPQRMQQVYISLIRGVNVGGNRKVAMEALRNLHRTIGLSRPVTLLQSGNVAFLSEASERGSLEERIGAAFADVFGFSAEVMVRSEAELKAAAGANPFPSEARSDPSHLLVMFLKTRPDKAAAARVEAIEVGRERIKAGKDELYLYYPDGIGRSKLTNSLIERQLGTSGTARNWSTVMKLIGMAAGLAKA